MLATLCMVHKLLQTHFPEHGPYIGVYAQEEVAGTLSVGDISQKLKAMIVHILDAKGKPIKLILSKGAVQRTPWPVSNFDGGEGCSLDIV